MTRSDSVGALAAALAKAQGAIKGAAKTSENPYFKSRYADLAAVWDACREALSANGLSVVQTMDSSDTAVCVETTLLHSSGEWISGSQLIKPVDDKPQSWGSAITYARRYGLAAIVGVAPEDDDGNLASGKPAVNTQAAADYVAKEKIAAMSRPPVGEKLDALKAEMDAKKTPPAELKEGEQVIQGMLSHISNELPTKTGKPYVSIEVAGHRMNVFDKALFTAPTTGGKSPLHSFFGQKVNVIAEKKGKFLNFVAIERADIQIKDEPEDPFALEPPGPLDENGNPLPF